MATAVFVQEGGAIDYTPGSAVAAGDVVVIGDVVAVARTPIGANALGSVAIEGIFAFPKATGTDTAIAAGTKVYWDATNKQVTATAGSNKTAGYTVAAAGNADATVRVQLSR